MSRRRRTAHRPTLTKAQQPAVRPEATFTADHVLALARAGFGGYARPMPRTELQVPFGPGLPVVPTPINPVRADTGRPEPRQTEYPVSWNLPGSEQRLIPWKVLRDAADRITLFRRCIEIRKNEVATLDWDITLSAKAIERAQRAAPDTSRKDIEAELRQRVDPHIGRLVDFWEQPDRRSGLDWSGWAKKFLEERFVLDAAAIYPRRTLGGDLYGLEILDGSTIKPLLDQYGYRPLPPLPAYQQVLWGFPRGEFVADTTETDDGAQVTNGYEADQLIYHVTNPRTWTPYGFSAVEQALDDGDLYLRRHAWLKAEYTDGVMPSGWLKAGEGQAEWSADQLRAYEIALNDLYAGQTAQRQRYRILPWGMEPHDNTAIDAQYKPDYDLMLIKLVAAHFDTTIAELGFTEQGGLGSTGWHEGQADVQDRKATQPTLRDLQALVTRISRLHLGMPPELEFKIIGLESEDENSQDEIADRRYRAGRMTLNEDRDRTGQPRYDFPEADKPFIVTSSGLVFIEGAEERAAQAAQAAPGPDGGEPDGTPGDDDGPDDGPDDEPDGGGGEPGGLTKADKEWLTAHLALTAPDATGTELADAQLGAAKADELAAWRRWRKRRGTRPSRPFEFTTLTKADLAATGEDPGDAIFKAEPPTPEPAQEPVPGQEWPGWQIDLAIAAIGAAALTHALTAAIDPTALIQAWLTHRGTSGTATVEDVTHWLTEQGVSERVAAAVSPVLRGIYTQGFYAGDRAAVSLLTGGPVDWKGWIPGDLTGARHLLSEDGRDVGLHRLLDLAAVPIKRVANTKMADIAAVLADGLTEKRSPAEMATALRGILDDRAWARMVALTETSRAATAAAHDRYEEAGVPATEWMTALDDRVCDICDGNEEAGPVPLGERYPSGHFGPPAHPHCRCATLPVLNLTKAEVAELVKVWDRNGRWHGPDGRFASAPVDAVREAAREMRRAAKRAPREKPEHVPTGYGLNGPVKHTEPGVHRALGQYHQAMAEGRWADAYGHLLHGAGQAKRNPQLKTSLNAAAGHLASKAPARVGVPHDQDKHLRLAGRHEGAVRDFEQVEGSYEEQVAARVAQSMAGRASTWEELGKPQGPSPVGQVIGHEGGTYERLPGEPRRYKVISADGRDISDQVPSDPTRNQMAEDARTALRMDAYDRRRVAEDESSTWRKTLGAVTGSWNYSTRDIEGFDAATPREHDAIKAALARWTGDKANLRDATRQAEPRVNMAIRGATPRTDTVDQDIRALDLAFGMSKTKRSVTVYRGFTNGEHILPEDWQARDLTGLEWSTKGFTPTSADETVAEEYIGFEEHRGFGVRLNLSKGSPAIAISDAIGGVDNEGEILLPRDLTFRVVKDRGREGELGLRWLDVEVVAKPRPAQAKKTGLSHPPAEAAQRLKTMGSTDEARQYLAGATKPELAAVADAAGVAYGKAWNKAQIHDAIVHHAVGRRLDSDAISRPRSPEERLASIYGPARAAETPEAKPSTATQTGRLSDRPLAPNTWGGASKPGDIHYHDDGAIGTAVKTMGDDRHLEVEGDALANVLGHVATDAVQGRITAQQQVDRLKQIRGKVPADSKARRAIDNAISDLDGPDTPAPVVPAGALPPLRQLAAELHAVPLVRREPERELDKLTQILDDFAAGKTGGLRLVNAVRGLRNQRHESTEGKFEIDRAIDKAWQALEEMQRTGGRQALYPPTQA